MKEITIPELNGGKPFEVGTINCAGIDELKTRASGIEGKPIASSVVAALLTSRTLRAGMGYAKITDEYIFKLRQIVTELDGADALGLVKVFEELNSDFLSKMAAKGKNQIKTPEIQPISSAPSATTSSSMPEK